MEPPHESGDGPGLTVCSESNMKPCKEIPAPWLASPQHMSLITVADSDPGARDTQVLVQPCRFIAV